MKGGNQREPEEGSSRDALQGREAAISKEVATRMKRELEGAEWRPLDDEKWGEVPGRRKLEEMSCRKQQG
jgi:hypothetical protein